MEQQMDRTETLLMGRSFSQDGAGTSDTKPAVMSSDQDVSDAEDDDIIPSVKMQCKKGSRDQRLRLPPKS